MGEEMGSNPAPSSSDLSTDSTMSSSSDISDDESSPASFSSSTPTGYDMQLHEISALLQKLPLRRGLSKHFDGKSRSFTSFANVRCIEDLVKPEKPRRKKLKLSTSWEGRLHTANGGIFKKTVLTSLQSSPKPPLPPQRTWSHEKQNFAPQCA